MYRTADDGSKLDVSWRLYLRQSGPEVSGAILRTSGDTGTLVGHWKDGRLVMSHFAGERPLLFEAQPNADGTLSVTLDRKSTYRAARTSEARAKGIPEPPDLSRFTSVTDPTARFHFFGPDLDGKMVRDTDSIFQGRVVVLTIGGTLVPELPRRSAVPGRTLQGLPRERPGDRGPVLRERCGACSRPPACARLHQALCRPVPDPRAGDQPGERGRPRNCHN